MRRGGRAVRWALGIGVLGVLVVGLDWREVVGHLAGADLPLAALGVAGLSAIHLAGAATWRALLRRLGGVVLPWRQVMGEYYAAQALGGITPANLGGDAYRVQALRGAGHGTDAALWPVVVQRVTSYLALSLLAAAALPVLGSTAGPAVGGAVWALAASFVVLGGAAVVFRARRSGRLPRAGQSAARTALVGIGGGLVFHAGSVLLTYVLVVSLVPAVPAVPVLAAIAVARLALAVPLTPSGLGIQEGLLSLLFAGLGLPASAALAAMVLSRCALLLTASLGSAALLGGRGPRRAAATHPDLRRVA